MSYYGESIYNLVPREVVVEERRQLPRKNHSNEPPVVPNSTFGCHGSSRLLGAGHVTKKDGAFFGPPKPETGLTRTFPKTMNGQSNKDQFQYTDKRKDTVPAKDDRPILGMTTTKNFITANAVEAILQAPKRPPPRELNYLKKEDFGKVPEYLTQVKEEIRRENDMIERYVKEQMGEVERTPETFEVMSEEERLELLDQLKSKWDHVNAQYQRQTHLVKLDTTGQVRRKEQLEHMLQQLENDIEKLQRSSSVLIRPGY